MTFITHISTSLASGHFSRLCGESRENYLNRVPSLSNMSMFLKFAHDLLIVLRPWILVRDALSNYWSVPLTYWQYGPLAILLYLQVISGRHSATTLRSRKGSPLRFTPRQMAKLKGQIKLSRRTYDASLTKTKRTGLVSLTLQSLHAIMQGAPQ